MQSVITICNLALSHLGDSATVVSIDPPEGSAQAEHCARFYPLARDALLEAHPWNFATRRERLALLAHQDSVYQYRYAMPNDALSVIAIQPEGVRDDYEQAGRMVPEEYQIERENGVRVVLCDTPYAVMRYISTATDPALYPGYFVEALAWKLAGMLCGPLNKGSDRVQECAQMFAHYFGAARQLDSKQRRVTLSHVVPWHEAR